MKFYGKAQEAAEKILEAFKTGSLPKCSFGARTMFRAESGAGAISLSAS
jgi:hypothetical protein